MKKTFIVRYMQEPDGWWVASIPEVQGCHTQGRSLKQARRRIREALWAITDDKKMAYSAVLVDDIQLPKALKTLLESAASLRATLEHLEAELNETKAKALKFTKKMKLSRRDAGELLGVSHQRIQQLHH